MRVVLMLFVAVYCSVHIHAADDQHIKPSKVNTLLAYVTAGSLSGAGIAAAAHYYLPKKKVSFKQYVWSMLAGCVSGSFFYARNFLSVQAVEYQLLVEQKELEKMREHNLFKTMQTQNRQASINISLLDDFFIEEEVPRYQIYAYAKNMYGAYKRHAEDLHLLRKHAYATPEIKETITQELHQIEQDKQVIKNILREIKRDSHWYETLRMQYDTHEKND